jgi:hypothetical protein
LSGAIPPAPVPSFMLVLSLARIFYHTSGRFNNIGGILAGFNLLLLLFSYFKLVSEARSGGRALHEI